MVEYREVPTITAPSESDSLLIGGPLPPPVVMPKKQRTKRAKLLAKALLFLDDLKRKAGERLPLLDVLEYQHVISFASLSHNRRSTMKHVEPPVTQQ